MSARSFWRLLGWRVSVHDGPELPLKKILDRRHRQAHTQDVTERCSLHEGCIPGIGLDLDSEIGARE